MVFRLDARRFWNFFVVLLAHRRWKITIRICTLYKLVLFGGTVQLCNSGLREHGCQNTRFVWCMRVCQLTALAWNPDSLSVVVRGSLSTLHAVVRRCRPCKQWFLGDQLDGAHLLLQTFQVLTQPKRENPPPPPFFPPSPSSFSPLPLEVGPSPPFPPPLPFPSRPPPFPSP